MNSFFTDETIEDTERIALYARDYFHQLPKLIQEEDPNVIHNYVTWIRYKSYGSISYSYHMIKYYEKLNSILARNHWSTHFPITFKNSVMIWYTMFRGLICLVMSVEEYVQNTHEIVYPWLLVGFMSKPFSMMTRKGRFHNLQFN